MSATSSPNSTCVTDPLPSCSPSTTAWSSPVGRTDARPWSCASDPGLLPRADGSAGRATRLGGVPEQHALRTTRLRDTHDPHAGPQLHLLRRNGRAIGVDREQMRRAPAAYLDPRTHGLAVTFRVDERCRATLRRVRPAGQCDTRAYRLGDGPRRVDAVQRVERNDR